MIRSFAPPGLREMAGKRKRQMDADEPEAGHTLLPAHQ